MLSAEHEGVMSMWERVNAFLTAQRPSRFCDDCIAESRFCDDCIAESLEVVGKPEVQKATSALKTTDSFHRVLGICSMCGKEKKVIQRA